MGPKEAWEGGMHPWEPLETALSLCWLPQAIIEEAEIRMAEVQKAMQEFEKDILKTIAKKKGSILATQKVLKYIEDANRRRVSWQEAGAWKGRGESLQDDVDGVPGGSPPCSWPSISVAPCEGFYISPRVCVL